MNVLILFSTNGGTTALVADMMKEHLRQLGHEVVAYQVDGQAIDIDLSSTQAIIFGAPTYENGQLESQMMDFFGD